MNIFNARFALKIENELLVNGRLIVISLLNFEQVVGQYKVLFKFYAENTLNKNT